MRGISKIIQMQLLIRVSGVRNPDDPPYGPDNGCERWDLAVLKESDTWMEGGDILRGKAIWYQQQEEV